MKNNFKKIISLLLIIGMNWSAISLIAGTDAYFNDTETSENNILTAGILDFELESAADFTPEVTTAEGSKKIIKLTDTTSTMDYNYTARTEVSPDIIVSGALCYYLLLEDNVSGASPQPLADFISNEVLFSDKQPPDWTFTASLDPVKIASNDGWENQVCNFDFIYEGHQEDCGGGGFSDVERISNFITTGDHLLITKVYYDPDDDRRDHRDTSIDERYYEWVEIYNPTGVEEDLSDWQICDDIGCDDLNSVIPRGKFAVITPHSPSPYNDTWTYWPHIPDNVVKIETSNLLGSNGLRNTQGATDAGDSVILKDASGIVDAMSYGNSKINTFDPNSLPCDGVDEGHMLGRVPFGEDYDTRDDWQDLSLPVVSDVGVAVDDVDLGSDNIINSLENMYCGYCDDITRGTCNQGEDDCHCGDDLYYSQELDITWIATNPNPTDSLIDVIYITDEDCSGNISDDDIRYTLESGIPNTGEYTWNGWDTLEEYWSADFTSDEWWKNWEWWKDETGTVVLPFYGLTWIEITATATENFMASDSIVSDPMFEPMPPIPQGVSIEKVKSMLENYSCGECCPGALEHYFEENFETDSFVSGEDPVSNPPSDGDGETQGGDGEEPTPGPSQEGNNPSSSQGGNTANTADGEEGDSGSDGDNPPATNPDDEEMKSEEGGEASGGSADGSDGDGADGGGNDGEESDGGATTDTTDITTDITDTATDTADTLDDEEPALDSLEEDGAGEMDDGLPITDDLADDSDDSDDGETVDDGEEEEVDLPLPITDDFGGGSDGGDGNGSDGEEPASDSSSDGGASEVE